MFRYVEQTTWCIWNSELQNARAMIGNNPDHYRVAFAACDINLIKNNITGHTSVKEAMLEDLNRADEVLNSVYRLSEAAILELAQRTIQMNKQSFENPVQGYQPPPLNAFELENMSEKQLIDNFRLDIETAQAEVSMQRGIVQFQNNSFLRGAYNLRKGWKCFEGLSERTKGMQSTDISQDNFVHPDIINAINYGVGTFQFGISVLPSTIIKVLSYLGFKADREEGIAMLRSAFNSQSRVSSPAAALLSVNYLFVPRAFADKETILNEYQPIIDKLVETYPNGSFFLYMAANFWRKKGDLDRAVDYLTKAVRRAEEEYNTTPSQHVFELAQCYFMQENYQKTTEQLEKVFNSHADFDMRGLTAMELAICYEHLGRHKECDDILANLDNYICKESRIDKYALEKNKTLKLLKKKRNEIVVQLHVAHYEIFYLKRDLSNLTPQDAKRLLASFKNDVGDYENSDMTVDTICACSVIEACLSRQIGEDLSGVKSKFSRVIELAPKLKIEKQWGAFANYEMAEVIYHENRGKFTDQVFDTVLSYLESAENYKNYPLEDILKTRIKMALKQVRNEADKSK
ncbi:tetratricopeptide repeat protein [Acrasis kona]|uniref:Tetratricopeptide repeat protein n=1 Tax=Acrasis kona TaxID=1008807 RepID=A0AAW2YWI3_9EUKA